MDKTKPVGMGIVVGALLVVAFLTVQQQVQAQNDRQLTSKDDAISAGWKEGKNDYLNGESKEYSCSSANTDIYCGLYRSGYNQGWEAQQNLGRGYGSEPINDDSKSNNDDSKSNNDD